MCLVMVCMPADAGPGSLIYATLIALRKQIWHSSVFFLLQNCTLSLRPKKEILKQSLDKQQVQLITYHSIYYSSRFSNQAKNRKCLNIRQHQNINTTTAKPSCMDLAIATIQPRERRKNEMSWLHEASVSQWNNRSS